MFFEKLLRESTTPANIEREGFDADSQMDPRIALDRTIKFFKLKAVDLSKASGLDKHELSKYRRGHKDMGSVNLMKVINVLPLNAQLYFCHLLIFGDNADFNQSDEAKKATSVQEAV